MYKLLAAATLAASLTASAQIDMRPSQSTDKEKIADALRAGPEFITKDALIEDWPANRKNPHGQNNVLQTRKGEGHSLTELHGTSHSDDHTYHVGPHVMIISPHNEDLAKFNRDGSKGQIYVSHLPGHSELYLIIPFKDWPQQ